MTSLNDVLLAMSNIPVDDPIAEIWGRGLRSGYKIIEYTGSLPITITADGNALLDYRIYGNTVQDGTPTPESPIVAEGVGERTENLINVFATDTTNGFVNNAFLLSNGNLYTPSKSFVSEYFPISENTVYTYFTGGKTGDTQSLCFYDNNKGYISGVAFNNVPIVTFTTPTNARYIRTTVMRVAADQESYKKAMLVLGDTAPTSFIPYGYKLPMTVSDGNTAQTVPVYIGEKQLDSVEGVSDYVDKSSGKIVRMIGEYTFTGDESFNKYGNFDVFYTSKTIDPVGITTVNTITMRCNHPAFTAIENKDTRYWLNPEADNICCFLPGGVSQVFLRSTSNFATAAECKAYLKAQYDNGTPVKISYWLKTPIEEDPPVSFPEIPTVDGTTIIDYDGDPKPSQMYVKYKGKG